MPRPSERTELLLRRYDLLEQYENDPDAVVRWLVEFVNDQPTLEEVHGLAEIAEIQASWSSESGNSERATRMYSTALIHAYQFLFDSNLNVARNAYDPQFRSICDIYNRSLEGLLREACGNPAFQSGHRITVGNTDQGIEFEIRIEGDRNGQDFERFELVSAYRASGLANHYHTYGLGVPLIAVRKPKTVNRAFEKYYPPDLTMPMTAFLSLTPFETDNSNGNGSTSQGTVRRGVLTLYNTLEQTTLETASGVIPLESDITIPLAYGLSDPLLSSGLLATASLLNAKFAPDYYGMYMIEPYDPNKIPVVMVHGFWSSPVTWVHMFNDLRANQDIHDNYQFWFYSYPTGQPFWASAKRMRDDLAAMRRELDPRGDSQSLDQMILVGHSMGGLLSTLQTVESDSYFWEVISKEPFEDLEGDPEIIENLRSEFYFRSNPSIDRVITIATPFQGSHFANQTTRWISQKLFTLPTRITSDFQSLAKQNEARLEDATFFTKTTSTDSLAPSNPMFVAFARSQKTQTVKTHNIVGRVPKKRLFGTSGDQDGSYGDGVVSLESAMRNSALSQVFVGSEHSTVHQHPGSIYEVRRILLENLEEKNRIRNRKIPEIPHDVRILPTPVQSLDDRIIRR